MWTLNRIQSKQTSTNKHEPFTSMSERGAANVSEPRLGKNPLLAAQLRSDNYYTPHPNVITENILKNSFPPYGRRT